MAQINEDLETLKTARDNMKTALGNKGQIVNNDIRTYASAIINIPSGSGSGDVKLFSTVEEMQADPDAQEGDLAVVYRSEVQPCTATTHFSKAIFPETVVLDSALGDYVELMFRPVDSSQEFECWGQLDSNHFQMDCYDEEGGYRIRYESQDGITYTRTALQDPTGEVTGNELDFGVEIYYEDEEMWNDVIGEFIQVGGSYFEGLYEYKTYIDKDIISIPLMSGLSNITSSSCDYNGARSPEFDLTKIKEMARQICIDEGISSGEGGFNITYKNNHIILLTVNEGGSLNSSFDTAYNVQNRLFNIYGNYNIGGSIYEYVLDLNNNTYIKNYIGQYSPVSQPPYAQYDYTLEGFMAMFVDYGDGYVFNAIPNDVYYIDGSNYSYSRINNAPSDYFVTKTNYKIADSQLTLSSSNQLLADIIGYGKNGVEIGTLGTPDNSFADVNAEVFVKIQNQYENMQPRILTDDDETIAKNIYFIPVKRNGTPLLDTSNVTNMAGMFYDCSKLTAIPELNTSNVTNMNSMFQGCSKLTAIPLLDTSNVTNMAGMFQGCSKLTAIPLLDTSNVTNMASMFGGCENLTTIPLLDTSNVTNMNIMFYGCSKLTAIPELNTSKVTNMATMFQSCSNLTTIPLLDTSNVTNMTAMFGGCSSLSNDSLNIIMQMCANATKMSSNKTLKYIGLTLEQVNKCKTLSNYSAFTSAGWTTGY